MTRVIRFKAQPRDQERLDRLKAATELSISDLMRQLIKAEFERTWPQRSHNDAVAQRD